MINPFLNKKRAEYVALQGSEEEKQDFLHWLDYSIGYATARFDFLHWLIIKVYAIII